MQIKDWDVTDAHKNVTDENRQINKDFTIYQSIFARVGIVDN